MSFGAPHWLWGLLAIPVLVVIFIRAEHLGAKRLHEFVSPRLLPQLSGTVNRLRRALRFALQLLGLACAVVALAQPRWGYTFQNVKRKGLDLLIAVDTSRSMESNDVQPNRLERVKLAAQDLINELQGDRVGLIAFAGRAFLQAPLTIDYNAAMESVNDLDTRTIPEGGTNISDAIALAVRTFGKSAIGNRALIIFTDGEELTGDAVDAAKAAANAGVRIFTIGVGTPQGSLIPVPDENGGTSFVKDLNGQVVKSKLDETRLREIARATDGLYFHLEDGPRTMHQLYTGGLAKMQAGQMDVRSSRRPIERYEWPLGAALLALMLSVLIGERKRQRAGARLPRWAKSGAPAAALLLLIARPTHAAAPGLDAYQDGKFENAWTQFQQTLKEHPNSHAESRLQFDSGAAEYKLKKYGKALESFSQALLSPDKQLQTKSYYNLGNTLYQQGAAEQSDEKKLNNWENALQHYQQALKLDPHNKEAKDNYDYVRKKIDELKKKHPPKPPPSPSPQQSNQGGKKNQNQQNNQQQQQQSKNQSGSKQEKKQQQSQGQGQQQKKEQSSAAQTPSPAPSPSQSPSPNGGKNEQQNQSSSSNQSPPAQSPTPGQGEGGQGANATPSATPRTSPPKKFSGEIKGAAGDQSKQRPQQTAQAEPGKEDQMSAKQAEQLLQSMKNEEARVQLDERRPSHRVYRDW
jgi:Ca-activated chloride channel homolog